MPHDTNTTGVTNQDPDQVEQARQLQDRYRGRWLIMWSRCSQRFLAWPTWFGSEGELLQCTDSQKLEQIMIEQEQKLGVHLL